MTMDAATPAAPKRSFPSSISLGSCIGGIPIKLHLTFFILLVIELISSFRYVNQFPIYILFVVVMWGPILFVTVLVHEFGHALTNKRQGGEVGGIVLWPLGGYAICGPADNLVGDFKVALAGPLTHIPMTFFWWMIYLLVKYEFDAQGNETGVWPPYALHLTTMSSRGAAGFFQVLAGEAVWLNILLFCFNLLIPAYPLDGGRVFAAGLMLKLKVEPLKAAFVTAWSGLVIASAMVAYAIVSIFTGGMVFGIYFGLVGIWVLFQSYELKCDVKAGDLKNHPIFGRECYQSSSGQTGSSAAAAAPSNGDDLEMAEDNIPAEEGVMA